MASEDRFLGMAAGSGDPSGDVLPVTPSDTQDLPYVTTALRASAAGTMAVLTIRGGTVVRTLNFLAGETRPVRVTRVLSTGTTATGIEAHV